MPMAAIFPLPPHLCLKHQANGYQLALMRRIDLEESQTDAQLEAIQELYCFVIQIR